MIFSKVLDFALRKETKFTIKETTWIQTKLNGTGKFWKQTIAKRNSEITPFVSIYSKSKKNIKYNDEIPFYIHTYTYTYIPTYIHTLFGKGDW